MPLVSVGGVGPKPARIMFVGEAPGVDEERLHQPFVGGAGQLLNTMLARVNINRDECYVTNLVKIRPPANDLSRLPELGYRIEDYIPLLQDEIEAVNPVVIVALGAYPAYYLTHKLKLKSNIPEGIFSWRGSVLPCILNTKYKVIPTIHPAAIMRDFSAHPLALYDLERVKLNTRYREIRLPDLTIMTRPTLEMIEEYVNRCIDKRKVSFDIETIGGKVRCLGLCCEQDSAICIPLKNGILNYWDSTTEERIWRFVHELFANTSVLKIAQNIQFDLHYLTPIVGFPARPLADTMLFHHLLYPELPHDLDTLCSIYTDIGYYGIGQVEKASDEATWVYNAKDVLATLISYDKMYKEASQIKHLPEHNSLLDIFHGFTMPLVRPLFEMQQRGILIDEDARDNARVKVETQLADLQKDLNTFAGEEINPKSPKQVADLLYKKRGYKTIHHRKTGNITTDKTALDRIANMGSEEASIILEIRRLSDLKSKFLDVEASPKSRFHTEYVISGTVTGRLSSREPLWGYGLNLQNIPRDTTIRAIFVPTLGNSFVKADLSQVEARIFAWLSEGFAKDAFKANRDVHSVTAAMIYGGSESAYPKGSFQRDERAKPIRHATNYGMGAKRCSQIVKCTEAEAIDIMARLHIADPSILEYHKQVQHILQTENRTLTTSFGRRRQFLGRWNDELFRQAYAYIPQSTAGDYLNIALLRLYFRLMEEFGPEAFMVLQVHDEIVVECPTSTVDRIVKLLHECLEYEIFVNNDVLTIPADVSIRHNSWAN
jgi:DNA polymerase I